jgi:hypothetical protein
MFKPKPRHLTIFFITVFIVQMILLVVLLLLPTESQAADPIKFKPQVEIPGFDKTAQEAGMGKDAEGFYTIKDTAIGVFIKSVYKYAVGIVGILAAVVLMFGGVVWLTAGGNQTRIGEAKAWIGASLTGLIIVLTSYMILYTVNPDLVQFRPIKITPVEDNSDTYAGNEGCCWEGGSTCLKKKEADCDISKGGGWYGTDKTKCVSVCGIDFWNNKFEAEGSW